MFNSFETKKSSASNILLFFFIIVLIIYSCKKKDIQPDVIELNNPTIEELWADAPYEKLSDYGIFVGALKNQEIRSDGIPYRPASKLFTDYAKKNRWVILPEGSSVEYVDDHTSFIFPNGTLLVKNFYYDNVQPSGQTKILETRIMIKKNGEWIFGEYIWNEEQTDAFLSMEGSDKAITWIHDNGQSLSTTYRFPSESECSTCHKSFEKSVPIALKPQNLNTEFAYISGSMNQIDYWINRGILSNINVSDQNSSIDYNDTSHSIERRLRSYLDVNCAHCHSEGGHCDYRPLRLSYKDTESPINMGLCVDPDEFINTALTSIVSPSNTARSVMYYRLTSNDVNVQMPMIGRTIVHQEGVDLLEQWINSKSDCN